MRLLQDRPPVHVRQHEVEDDDVRLELVEGLDGRAAFGRPLHLVALGLQIELLDPGQIRLVFDDQDATSCHVRTPSPRGMAPKLARTDPYV